MKHVGALWSSASPTTFANQKAAMESVGFTYVYDRATQATETDFTADIVRMKSLGVQFLNIRSQGVTTIAHIMNNAAQQNWHPQIVVTNSQYDTNSPSCCQIPPTATASRPTSSSPCSWARTPLPLPRSACSTSG